MLLSSLLLTLTLHVAAAEVPAAAFSKSPAELLRESKDLRPHKDADVIILLHDSRIEIDKAGRRNIVEHVVVKFTGSKAAESSWATVEENYSPWRQNKPELKARVVDKQGEAHWLDTKTIAEGPAHEANDGAVFTDERRVQAPLPAVADGSIAEYEIKVREHRPFFDHGVANRISFHGVPPRLVHVTIEAPAGFPLRYHKSAEIPDAAVSQTKNKVTLLWEPTQPAPDAEFDWRKDPVTFAYATGTSWADVAAAYERVVEEVLASPGAEIEKLTAGVPKGLPVKELAARLAERLHEKIRYTGIEFGENAIVPVAPAVAFERKFGDCKDKAALLVAMLRSYGVKAHVALLDTGTGEENDVEPSLPGLGVFNHAIAYVPGNPPLWIDATADTTPVGALPTPDQGRRALVAAQGVTDLIRTPEDASSANVRLAEVEMRLKPDGKGEIKETITPKGSFEAELRNAFTGVAEEDRKELERVAKDTYLSSKLGTFTTPKSHDWSKPYRVEFTALEAGRAITEGDEGAAGLFEHFVFESLPWQLTAKKKPEKPSTKNLTLPMLFVSEYRYRVYPPAGFKLRTLPKPETLRWGPVTYERKFASHADGMIEANFRFDTGSKRVLTPEEVEQVRAGVTQYSEGKPVLLSFLSEAAEATALGDAKGAMQAAVKAVKADPKSAGARVRLAKMLLQAGAGDAAREAARIATELDAKSVAAFHTLGWTLQHDSFGRRFAGNWDQAGAIAAHRKAMELEPDALVPAMDLAILLEHDKNGNRYGEGAALKDVEPIYRKLLAAQENVEVRNNLCVLLLHQRQFDAMEKEIGKLDPGRGHGFETVLAALREGSGRAMVLSQQHYPEAKARGEQALWVARTLIQLREYPKAGELFKIAARLMNNTQLAAQSEVFAKLRKSEEIPFEKNDPKYPVYRFFRLLFSPMDQAAYEELLGLMVKEARTGPGAGSIEEMRAVSIPAMVAMKRSGLSERVALDFLLSAIQLEAEGDDAKGYRISMRAPGTTKSEDLYVVKEDGEYRVLASNSDGSLLGKKVLDLAEAGDLDGARMWLDRMVKTPPMAGADGSTGMAVYAAMWSGVTPETRGKQAILNAGAAALGASSNSPRAIAILQAGLAKATNAVDRNQIQLALAQSYVKASKWKELLDVAYRLEATTMFASDGLRYELQALEKLGRWADLQKSASAKLATNKENAEALRAMLAVAEESKDPEKIADAAGKLSASFLASSSDRERAAWAYLLLGKPVVAALASKLTEDQAPTMSAAHYYVTGLVQAQDGKPEDGARSLGEALNHDDFLNLDAQPWVLQGKILNGVGLPDEAAKAYEKAKAAKKKSDGGTRALRLIGTTR